MNMVLGIDNFDQKLKIRANVVPTLKFASVFMKFSSRYKSNMLIINKTLTSFLDARVIIGSK